MKKLTARLLAFAVVAAACVATARAGGEGYFVKKATWVETIVASREALSAREARARQDLVDDKHGFQPVEVKISGNSDSASRAGRACGRLELWFFGAVSTFAGPPKGRGRADRARFSVSGGGYRLAGTARRPTRVAGSLRWGRGPGGGRARTGSSGPRGACWRLCVPQV
jgi:hypothetical protein